MSNKPIPNRLHEQRQKAGLLQREVASQLGLDCADRISQWENGTAMPSVMNLFKLSALYNVPPQELYQEMFEGIQQNIVDS